MDDGNAHHQCEHNHGQQGMDRQQKPERHPREGRMRHRIAEKGHAKGGDVHAEHSRCRRDEENRQEGIAHEFGLCPFEREQHVHEAMQKIDPGVHQHNPLLQRCSA